MSYSLIPYAIELKHLRASVGSKKKALVEAVVKGIAYASDYLSLLKAGFKLLQVAGTAAVHCKAICPP